MSLSWLGFADCPATIAFNMRGEASSPAGPAAPPRLSPGLGQGLGPRAQWWGHGGWGQARGQALLGLPLELALELGLGLGLGLGSAPAGPATQRATARSARSEQRKAKHLAPPGAAYVRHKKNKGRHPKRDTARARPGHAPLGAPLEHRQGSPPAATKQQFTSLTTRCAAARPRPRCEAYIPTNPIPLPR